MVFCDLVFLFLSIELEFTRTAHSYIVVCSLIATSWLYPL